MTVLNSTDQQEKMAILKFKPPYIEHAVPKKCGERAMYVQCIGQVLP